MTPNLLAEYIAAVGLTLTGLFVIVVLVLGWMGFFDK